MYLGIEIGGTKLQLGLGAGDGVLPKSHRWRDAIVPAEGSEGIRRRIEAGLPQLLSQAGVDRGSLRGVGIGFGGPVDDATRTVIKSHQIAGWDGFPLADWISDLVGVSSVLGNDADVAGLAEALFGAGKGLSPIFYMTIGSGIGGGLIIDGEIYRGVGKGAAEIGHLAVGDYRERSPHDKGTLENIASGWGIAAWARERLKRDDAPAFGTTPLTRRHVETITALHVAAAALAGDEFSRGLLRDTFVSLAEAISQLITLLCPRRVVIGGGVPLIGEELFFNPLRAGVELQTFRPFAGLTDIVPAALGEEVVVHGALALARKKLGG